MARKCGNCGAPAPDTNSRFCDLCGAPLIEEPVTPQGLPVCPACGTIVSDKKAQFCDVCGAPLAKPVCPACGPRHRLPAQNSVPGAVPPSGPLSRGKAGLSPLFLLHLFQIRNQNRL